MTQFELDERNKALILENNKIRRIIDEVDLLHYRSINEEAANERYESLVKENIDLKTKLSDIYDL
jgi:regulator of replication initiation timing